MDRDPLTGAAATAYLSAWTAAGNVGAGANARRLARDAFRAQAGSLRALIRLSLAFWVRTVTAATAAREPRRRSSSRTRPPAPVAAATARPRPRRGL